jgi:hypothetical protein
VNCRLSPFSGDGQKNEVKYHQWRWEIAGLQREGTYSEAAILNVMRRAAKGTALDVLCQLPVEVSLSLAMEQLDLIFGDVMTGEAIMEQFYCASQEATESVAAWSCRLNTMIVKVVAKKTLAPDTAARLLRNRFWMGLCKSEYKMATRHCFDSQMSFEDLLYAVRKVEGELPPMRNSKSQTLGMPEASGQADTLLSRIGELSRAVTQFGSRLTTLERGNSSQQTGAALSFSTPVHQPPPSFHPPPGFHPPSGFHPTPGFHPPQPHSP